MPKIKKNSNKNSNNNSNLINIGKNKDYFIDPFEDPYAGVKTQSSINSDDCWFCTSFENNRDINAIKKHVEMWENENKLNKLNEDHYENLTVLDEAISKNWEECGLYLISKGARISKSSLHMYLVQDKFYMIKRIVETFKIDLHEHYKFFKLKDNPLNECVNTDIDAYNYFLNIGFKPEPDEHDNLPAHIFIKHCKFELVLKIFENDPSQVICRNNKKNILHIVAEESYYHDYEYSDNVILSFIRTVIEKYNVDINFVSVLTNETPLNTAIRNNNFKIARFFLKVGASTYVENSVSFLESALVSNSELAVEFVLQNDFPIDINRKKDQYNVPEFLITTYYNSNLAGLNALIKSGVLDKLDLANFDINMTLQMLKKIDVANKYIKKKFNYNLTQIKEEPLKLYIGNVSIELCLGKFALLLDSICTRKNDPDLKKVISNYNILMKDVRKITYPKFEQLVLSTIGLDLDRLTYIMELVYELINYEFSPDDNDKPGICLCVYSYISLKGNILSELKVRYLKVDAMNNDSDDSKKKKKKKNNKVFIEKNETNEKNEKTNEDGSNVEYLLADTSEENETNMANEADELNETILKRHMYPCKSPIYDTLRRHIVGQDSDDIMETDYEYMINDKLNNLKLYVQKNIYDTNYKKPIQYKYLERTIRKSDPLHMFSFKIDTILDKLKYNFNKKLTSWGANIMCYYFPGKIEKIVDGTNEISTVYGFFEFAILGNICVHRFFKPCA